MTKQRPPRTSDHKSIATVINTWMAWYIDSLTINDYVYIAYHGYILHALYLDIMVH